MRNKQENGPVYSGEAKVKGCGGVLSLGVGMGERGLMENRELQIMSFI